MTDLSPTVTILSSSEIGTHIEDLCRVLIDSVTDGAAISFMATMTKADAETFWLQDVSTAIESENRYLFGAKVKGQIVGTVQLVIGMPPNQPHRAEISKMIVHPGSRRLGLGRALMAAALDVARSAGKTLITLDTRTGDVSETFYSSVGFERAGVIPDYAFDPDGRTRHATTYMYRYL